MLMVAGAASPSRADDAGPSAKQRLDNAYQSAIAHVADAATPEAMGGAIDQLLTLDRGGMSRVVSQVMLYRALNDSKPSTRAVVGHIFKRLERDKPALVATLAPHLDDADPRIQRFTRDLLRGYEDRSALRAPDYSMYHAILESDFRAKREPQASLISFMYEGDPGVALLTIMRASQLRDPAEIKPILWAEHVVGDLLWRRQFGFVKPDAVEPQVVAELDKLSQHKEWWARMYVAEMIRRHPELGTKALRDRLAADSHVLVRGTLSMRVNSK